MNEIQVNQALKNKKLKKSIGAELQEPYSQISQYTNSLMNTQTNFPININQNTKSIDPISQRSTQTKFHSIEPYSGQRGRRDMT